MGTSIILAFILATCTIHALKHDKIFWAVALACVCGLNVADMMGYALFG